MAKVVLKDGTSVVGSVLRQSKDAIVLSIGGEDLVIRMDEVHRLEMLEPGAATPGIHPPKPQPPAGDELAGTDGGPPRTGTEPPPLPGGSGTMEQFFDPAESPSQWLDRYVWFVPKSTATRVSVGVAVWIFLGLLVYMSAAVIGGLERSFLRAQLMSLILLAIGAVEVVVFPFEGLKIVAFVVLDLVLWLLVTQIVFQTGILRSLGMLVCMIMLGLLSVLCLEVALYLMTEVGSRTL